MKMFKKAIIFATVFASAGLMAESASAATVVGSPYAQLAGDASGGFTVSFVNNFTNVDSGGTFDDQFAFAIGATSESGGSVSSNFTSTQALTLSSFNLVKFTNDAFGNPVILSTITGISPASNYFTLNASNLGIGDYYIEVTGTVKGVNGGSYGGSLNVTAATAVPEPATYGMLLGGLGLIGFVARRKKQS
jgi:hypothetical protein